MNKATPAHADQIIPLLREAYASRINNLRKSIELGKQALVLSRDDDDKPLIGASLNLLSLFYMISGAYKRSVSMAREAIKVFEELKFDKGLADAQYNIGSVYYKTDNYHLGMVYLTNSLATYRKLNDYHNQARTQKSLGTIYEYIGDQKSAINAYEQSIAAAKKIKDANFISNAYNPLSGIYLNQGKIKKAMDLIEKSIRLKTQTNDVRGMAFALYGRGKIYIKTGQYEEAERDLLESLRIHLEAGERLGPGMTYHKLGALYMAKEQLEKARNVLETGLAYSTRYKHVIIMFKCHLLLYELYKRENNPEKALYYLELYLHKKEAVINTQTLKVIENYELITKLEALEYEARVQREKADIIEKKERAEHLAKVKQDFLSTMSHEIRTPLNAVITITSLLRDKAEADEQVLLESLKFASNNLLLIINDILDFTKLESGKVALDFHPSNFRRLLNNIKLTYDSMARDKSLVLSLRVDADINEAYELDETKLSQIMGNLISNAIKYTEAGRVDVAVNRLGGTADEDELRFSITDTGVGIPDGFRSEIFSSFSQPKSITTKKQGGSGLGLAIVKKMLELHKSAIQYNSTVGEGSEFYFVLKLKKSVAPVKVPKKLSDQLKNKFVLLAEDNHINAFVARKLLSNWGIISVHAANGVEAIEQSKLKVFDFILMDIHMPEMNGFDATRHIRNADNPNCRTPIFALTADITAEHQEEYNDYFNGFLRKPIELQKLYEALTVPS